MLTGVLRGVLAELSSVHHLPTAQARPKRNRPEEDTADSSESGHVAANPAAPLHPGRSYPSDHIAGIIPQRSGPSSEPLPVATSMDWSSLLTSFAETSRIADTGMTVPMLAPSVNYHGYASPDLDSVHQGTLANLPPTPHSYPRSPEPLPALQAGSGHQQGLAETYIPSRVEAQQGFYDSIRRGLASVDSIPLLPATRPDDGNLAQGLSEIFDLSTLDVPDATGDLPGTSAHHAPSDTQ